MSETTQVAPVPSRAGRRAAEAFADRVEAGRREVDRMFAALIGLEWAASIAATLAIWRSDRVAALGGVGPSLWPALALGGLAALPPIALATARPGRASTRQGVAIGQIMLVALLIHLSGGRPGSHFLAYGSLAMLALYRDWRALATAGLAVALGYGLGGAYDPWSAFGTRSPGPWAWAEPSLWAAFEVAFLILGTGQSLAMTLEASRGRAEAEERAIELRRARLELEDRRREHAEEVRELRDSTGGRAAAHGRPREARALERADSLERANAELIAEVAERRQAEAQAHRSRESAESTTRAKSEFLANMSHEIRTPMNAIIGMTELTLGMELDPAQRDNLEVVRVAADALLDLIDDILDFSKIEAGKLDIEPIRFRPREAVEAAVKTLSLRAAEKGLSLSARIAPEVPDSLVGDPHRLRQVLLNLLGNAIKFTPRGRVEVRVGPEPETIDPDGLTLRFSVVDEGIGIPASRLSMIFDPFSQADGSTTRRFGGTGLGLSISSRLVELMEGRIWVESEVGRGTTFHFTARFGKALGLPDGPIEPEGPGLRRSRSAGLRRLRVLLVDDNELNRRVGMRHLERLGHDVRLAVSGHAALARFENEGPFDLVLMDVQMPEMDGFEATALIRAVQERQGRRCPIIALTAFAMKGDRDRCLAGGMDDHLAKPIRGEDLGRLIDGLEAVERPPEPLDARWSLDPEEVRAAMPIGDAEMAEIVGLFRATCREQLAEMARAIASDDPDALAASAHAMKGNLALFATGSTVALADGLEEAGRSKDLGGSRLLLSKLEAAIAAIRPTLDQLAEVSKGEGAARLIPDPSSSP